MEHEEFPGYTEGEHIEWWEITLETTIVIVSIALGNFILLVIGLYLLFSSIVLKGAFKNGK